MPRSSVDATRFTSTGPYVSTKPSQSSSTNFSNNSSTASPTSFTSSRTELPIGSAPPLNETAQQKIARLRAAAQLAKQGQESAFDRTVRVGRIWADRAHRVTALSLIGLTVVSGVVATAGITDMLLHNRRRRNEWLAEKKAESARDLAMAIQAASKGSATEDQILLINRVRASAEAEEAKRNRPGMFKRASNWLFSRVPQEEVSGDNHTSASTATVSVSQNSADQVKSVIESVGQRVDANRRQGEKVVEDLISLGGPLDRQAQHVVDAASNATRSWTNWIRGR